MRAYATVNGGVMFVPDEIDQVSVQSVPFPTSQTRSVQEPAPAAGRRFVLFGRRRADQDSLKKVA